MSEFLHWLLSSENFMPHGHCFLWQPGTLWLNVGSDLLIATSYFMIPVAIYYFMRQRRPLRYAWVPMMFAAFIFLCGATHIMEIWTVWNPVYRVAGALKLLTGVVSFATLALLIWIMPRALLLKTPGQLHAEVEARTFELRELNRQLREQIAARDAAVQQHQIAEEARARADAMLHAIVQSAPSLIYAKDREGRMLLANPQALKLIGKTWSDVKGRTDLEFLEDRSQAEAVTRNDRHLMEANHVVESEEVVGTKPGEERVWFSIKAPLRDDSGGVIGLVGVSVEITERKRLEHRLRLMVDELNHRVKNTLATVQAVAAQTLRGANQLLYTAFQDRLLSLATAHDVLMRENWTGAEVYDVVLGQLSPYGAPGSGRFELSGPKLRLSSKAALALAMQIHELATNALKHGALSNEQGRVELRWSITQDAVPMLRLTWTERGGPEVAPPRQRGLGSLLIERILARDLSATVRLDFDSPAGIICTMESPVTRVAAPAAALQFPQIGGAAWAAS